MTDFNEALKSKKTIALLKVIRDELKIEPRRILVVGCGSGLEAGMLAREFQAETYGIDLVEEFDFDHAGSHPAKLLKMDARDLRFEDDHFDFVFSFHALEHIPGPDRALAEMARVLAPGGAYVVGTPNKARLVGYVGSARPLRQKIKFNLMDLGMRLRGKWSNEQGAHAGFTLSELKQLCSTAFGSSQAVSDAYYHRLYASKKGWLDMLTRLGVKSFIYPCVYVAGSKRA